MTKSETAPKVDAKSSEEPAAAPRTTNEMIVITPRMTIQSPVPPALAARANLVAAESPKTETTRTRVVETATSRKKRKKRRARAEIGTETRIETVTGTESETEIGIGIGIETAIGTETETEIRIVIETTTGTAKSAPRLRERRRVHGTRVRTGKSGLNAPTGTKVPESRKRIRAKPSYLLSISEALAAEIRLSKLPLEANQVRQNPRAERLCPPRVAVA